MMRMVFFLGHTLAIVYVDEHVVGELNGRGGGPSCQSFERCCSHQNNWGDNIAMEVA